MRQILCVLKDILHCPDSICTRISPYRYSIVKGAKKAIIALARKLLVIIYTMLKQGTAFDESCFEARKKKQDQNQASYYIRQLQKQGYRIEAPVQE